MQFLLAFQHYAVSQIENPTSAIIFMWEPENYASIATVSSNTFQVIEQVPGQKRRERGKAGTWSARAQATVKAEATASHLLSFENCLYYQIIYDFNDYRHNFCFFAKKLTQKNLSFSFSFLIFSKYKTKTFLKIDIESYVTYLKFQIFLYKLLRAILEKQFIQNIYE